jgi:TrmH family RNA methyltransferase
MIDNPRSPRVRAVAKLAKRSARAETGLFLVEGPQSVSEALAFHPENLVELFVSANVADRYSHLVRAAAEAGVPVETVTDAVLEAMADTVTPQGVIATCRQLPTTIADLLARKPKLVAILEEVRDPGNAGTIIRAADAVGADGVIFTGNSVDAYNPKVVRSTTGSIFHVPVAQNGTLDAALDAVRAAGLQVLAADVKGADLPRVRDVLAEPTAWVFGNEAHGLPDEQLRLADRVVKLPIYGRAESLNLATAASVCLYESAFAQRA